MKKVFVTSLAVVSLTFPIAVSLESSQQVQTIQVAPPMGVDGMQLPGRGQQKTGTGRIRGRLVTIDTGAPVRRAQVRISSPDILPRTAVTDGDGRYEFKDLPASKFTITATKSGFVTMNYGQKRPFETGMPIELGEAGVLEKADIAMPRGSAISGRIIDEFG